MRNLFLVILGILINVTLVAFWLTAICLLMLMLSGCATISDSGKLTTQIPIQADGQMVQIGIQLTYHLN